MVRFHNVLSDWKERQTGNRCPGTKEPVRRLNLRKGMKRKGSEKYLKELPDSRKVRFFTMPSLAFILHNTEFPQTMQIALSCTCDFCVC